jgi:hypothetical protein
MARRSAWTRRPRFAERSPDGLIGGPSRAIGAAFATAARYVTSAAPSGDPARRVDVARRALPDEVDLAGRVILVTAGSPPAGAVTIGPGPGDTIGLPAGRTA